MNFLDNIVGNLQWPGISGALEILVLGGFFYYIILFFRGTRGAQVLTGLILSMLLLMLVTQIFRLDALNWILRQLSVYVAIAFIIIFQPEIRRAFAELGKQPVFPGMRGKQGLIDKLSTATLLLAERKIGALIAIEQEIGTRAIQDSGTRLDCNLSSELLTTIFFPSTPLHDGGVIVRENHILAAGCVFPLSPREELSKTLGTRHRAAIGLTEETDAVVIIVSEETGTISVAYRGRLSRGLDGERLRRMLKHVLSQHRLQGRTNTPPTQESTEEVPHAD